MRRAALLVTIAVLISAAVCVRLGLWQLSRWHEKRALNAAIRTAERSPELVVTGEPPAADAAIDRSIRLGGRYDESRQFLLSGVLHDGEPGVEVVTPLLLAGDASAVLVKRGWLPAADAMTARPQDHPEPGERTVEGVVEAIRRGGGPPGPRVLAADTVTLWSVRWLDADSIAARLPYAVAAYVVRQRPGAGVPALPRRTARPLHDEMVHLSYALQWFLFAILIPAGTAALAWSRRRRPSPRSTPETTT